MKTWSADHPKAKLMAGKRADILGAARASFLARGYEGTSMEAVAAAAGVSIMTLYRHAQGKDDLFAAVITDACDLADPAEQAALAAFMRRPLAEILDAAGRSAQQRIARPETVALLRTVVAEAGHFPHLAEMTYRALVGHWEDVIAQVLSAKVPAADLADGEPAQLSAAFVDHLFGTDVLRLLLGLEEASPAARQRRVELARRELLAGLEAQWPNTGTDR
ncbi:hypothetical protein tb265_19470 [Gemmatimonadetes bacterium T265]|nr:hypothetical protein tb265_19470 [Gemmatimonadetes bacterium T265]